MTEATTESKLENLEVRLSQLSKDFIETGDDQDERIALMSSNIDLLIQRTAAPAQPPRDQLYAALAKAQGEIQAAEANQEAEIRAKDDYSVVLYTFKYADLAACLEVIRKPLSDNGLALIQIPSLSEGNAVHMKTVIGHSSGQYITCDMMMYSEKGTPQAIGTCMSYLRRYSLCAMIGVAQFDDDAVSAVADPSDYEKITAEEVDAILALADDLFKDRADFVIQQMVEKTFDVTHVSQIKAGEADLAIKRLKNTDRREKAKAKKGAGDKPSPEPPEQDKEPEAEEREPGSDDDK